MADSSPLLAAMAVVDMNSSTATADMEDDFCHALFGNRKRDLLFAKEEA